MLLKEIIGQLNRELFTQENLARMSIAVQMVKIPEIKLCGEALNVSTPYGNWSGIGNGTIITDGQTLVISFLEMQYPIIESFIIPWLSLCLNTSASAHSIFNYPFPRIDIAIKFYRPDFPTMLKYNAQRCCVYKTKLYLFF
jgi:hypothetical protein